MSVLPLPGELGAQTEGRTCPRWQSWWVRQLVVELGLSPALLLLEGRVLRGQPLSPERSWSQVSLVKVHTCKHSPFPALLENKLLAIWQTLGQRHLVSHQGP